jgi:hypothetical protein
MGVSPEALDERMFELRGRGGPGLAGGRAEGGWTL